MFNGMEDTNKALPKTAKSCLHKIYELEMGAEMKCYAHCTSKIGRSFTSINNSTEIMQY